MKANFLIIAGDIKITEFMQACDVFEKDKVAGNMQILSIDYKKGTTQKALLSKVGKVITAFKDAFEKSGHIVSLVHLLSIENNNKSITYNKNLVRPYINKDVRMISDGKSWFVFYKYLQHLGIKVNADDNFRLQKELPIKKKLLIEKL